MQIAYHYAVDFYNVENPSITDSDYLLTSMKAAVELIKSSEVSTSVSSTDNHLYLLIKLENGFFHMHAAPLQKFCNFDYYDSQKSNIKYVIDYLTNLLNPKTIRILELKRGLELATT